MFIESNLIPFALIGVSTFSVVLGLRMLQKQRSRLHIIFFFLALSLSAWTLAILMSWLSLGSPQFSFWVHMGFVGPSFLAGFLLYFSKIFPFDRKEITLKPLFLYLSPVPLILLFAFQGKIYSTVVDFASAPEKAIGLYVFDAYILSAFALTLFNFFKTHKAAQGIDRQRLKIFLTGLIFAISIGIFFNVFFPQVLGDRRFNYLGPSVGVTLFLIFTFYAILKHHLFNIRVIATEILAFFLVGASLVPLSFASNLSEFTVSAILVILVIALVILLLGTMDREIRYLTQAIAYEELKKLNQAKSEFIATASHQLRTPLSTLKAYIFMMMKGMYKTPKERKEALEKMQISNERLIVLADNLLNASRIEAGQLELEKEPVILPEVLREILPPFRQRAQNRGLRIHTHFGRNTNLPISLDRRKIEAVIANVLDNALRYTKKGSIEIKLKAQNPKSKNAVLTISVADTGKGLTKEELQDVFTSFKRGKTAQALWTEGVGLSLYVTKQLVEAHGGKMYAKSPGPGKGSTFSVELPLKSL